MLLISSNGRMTVLTMPPPAVVVLYDEYERSVSRVLFVIVPLTVLLAFTATFLALLIVPLIDIALLLAAALDMFID